MSDPLAWLADHAAARESDGLRRRLRARQPADDLIDLAGNDYLGLSRNPQVVEAAVAATRLWGAGSTGSRLVTGTTALHEQLETALAAFVGFDGALVFSSGYLANLGVISALAGPGDLVVSDAHVHASLIDACRLARATVRVVAHADPAAVDAALREGGWRRALVVTDSVFSVDGDTAPLGDLHDVARASGAVLVVDEAHALGVAGPGGRGALAAAGLAGEPDVVMTATLSKALASQGGVVLAGTAVVAHLVDAARSFIFDTALSPAAVGAALSALAILESEPELAARVRTVAGQLASAARPLSATIPSPAAAVVAVPMGSPDSALAAGAALLEAGVRVGVFRPPSVPDGVSRLRLTARADLRPDELALVRSALASLRP